MRKTKPTPTPLPGTSMLVAVDDPNRQRRASLLEGKWSVVETFLDGRDPLAIEVDQQMAEHLDLLLFNLQLNLNH